NLRYINRIDIPQHPLSWERWFNFSLPSPDMDGSTIKAFQMHFERVLTDNRTLIVNCVTVPPPQSDVSSVILDLDVSWSGDSVASKQLPQILDHVHAPHRLAFEAYINDNLRYRFDEK
ncbi:MAG: TIGR04255 family protein, partial [Nitrospira sp.]|nr:TIGR04255 family protein [Nitrospira sp.]